MEERIEERRAPPRYENPPDILPNPNSDGPGRVVTGQVPADQGEPGELLGEPASLQSASVHDEDQWELGSWT